MSKQKHKPNPVPPRQPVQAIERPAVAVMERPAPPSHEEDPFLTYSACAAIVGVSPGTISNWVCQKLLKAEWRGPRLVIRESTLRAFMGRNYEPAAKPRR